MAKTIATVGGVALAPGVSANGRLYTKAAIAKMVARAQERIKSGSMPLTMLSHHGAGDDSTRIVGRITQLGLDEDGAARFEAAVAGTAHGRSIASLLDTSDGDAAFLKNVSIRGWWAGDVETVPGPDGSLVTTCSDLELDGLDFTKSPGVSRAGVDSFAWTGGRPTEADGRVPLTESVQEARVTITDEAVPVDEAAELTGRLDALRDTFGLVEHVLADGFCTTCAPADETAQPMGKRTSGIQGPGGPYADPGYQADKKPRYQLDTKAHAKAALAYVSQKDNAAKYTAAQLKRIRSRILAALRKFGVKTSSSESWASGATAVTEHFGDSSGSFSVSLNNGAVCVTVSSYCVDPCDLDVIGTAAMNGACLALGAMDPDMDGDIDVPGADAEDDDGDNGDAMTYKPPADRETAPEDGGATETTTDPAPDPAADPHTETEVPAMADTDKPAVEATPAAATTEAAPAAPQMVSFTTEQFAQLMATRPATAETAAPVTPAEPAVAESEDDKIAALVAAGVAEAVKALAPAVPEPVAETLEQKVARLVEAGVTEAKQALVASGAVDLSRRGVVRMATETATGGSLQFNEHGQPSTWPNKPLHQYSTEELAAYAGPVMDHWIMKGRAVTDLD